MTYFFTKSGAEPLFWRVARDPSQAANWFLRAAESGDALGQFNYAVALTKGIGVEIDLAQAVQWYRRAAESGHYPSQARLGYCYAKGLGVANDPIEAFVWLSLASRHGVGLAMTELEGLVKSMTGDQKATAQQRLSRWIAISERGKDVLVKATG